jgi:serine/threonine-protein kinase
MFEMLAGRLPFVASTQQQLAMMHLREEPPRLSMFNQQMPETLERIIHKVLAKEPAARYRTADQLGRILISYRQQGEELTGAQIASGNTPVAPQPVVPPRPANGAAITATATRKAEAAPTVVAPAPADDGLDWMAVGLGFAACLAVIGLIPLYWFVYLAYAR